MPVWLIPFLIRYVLPAILMAAQKSGLINEVEKVLINFGLSLETYPEYPTGKNGQSDETPHTNNNLGK